MINRGEICNISRTLGLLPHVVEKDYVLGWVLAGVHSRRGLTKGRIFKGGTCLKKCHFETYRFSEDLDFTVIERSIENGSAVLQRKILQQLPGATLERRPKLNENQHRNRSVNRK